MSAAVLLLLIGVILMGVSALLDLASGVNLPAGLSSCLYKLAWMCFMLWLLLGMGKLAIG